MPEDNTTASTNPTPAPSNATGVPSPTNDGDAQSLTFGQKAVGLSFNPSGNVVVQNIKEKFAAIIDGLNSEREAALDGETKRMYSVAITEAQSSQMWAVKAATWGK